MKRFLSTVVLVLFATVASAATVGIMPDIVFRFWNSTGTAILSGGYVVTCPAGTTCSCTSYTDQVTYTTSAGTQANENPVPLNSRGEASIWLESGLSYKITVCDRYGNLQKSTDGVVAIEQVTAPEVNIWQLIGGTPTYLNATQFSVLGDYTSTFTTGRRLKSTVSAGAIYSTVSTTAPVFASGITTVTVVNDSTNLDSGLSSVSINIIDIKTGMSTNVPGTVVSRDSSGLVTNMSLTGTTTISGALSSSATSTFSGNLISDATGTLNVTNMVKTGTTVVTDFNADLLDGMTASSANTGTTVVSRDASGNFAAGTITANLTGNASGSSGSCTGNSVTATTAENLYRSGDPVIYRTSTATTDLSVGTVTTGDRFLVYVLVEGVHNATGNFCWTIDNNGTGNTASVRWFDNVTQVSRCYYVVSGATIIDHAVVYGLVDGSGTLVLRSDFPAGTSVTTNQMGTTLLRRQ